MVAETELPPDLDAVRRESLKHGMTTAEGVEAFDRILSSGLQRVVVSAFGLREGMIFEALPRLVLLGLRARR